MTHSVQNLDTCEDDFLPRDSMELMPACDHTEIMYHGTSREAAKSIQREGFRPSSDGPLGRGVYLSRDLQKARRYPLEPPESQRVVIKVKVNVGRVIAINRQGHPMQKTWHDLGYDTAWVPPNCGMFPSSLEEHCVWDPKRITVMDLIYTKSPKGLSGLMPACDPTYTMYHGTSRAAAGTIQREGFRQSRDGPLGRGVYLSRDFKKASRYPLGVSESQRVIVEVKVRVGKVKKIDYQDHPLRKKWHDKGYDTAWVPPNCGHKGVPSGREEDCVWDPTRITIMNLIYPKEDDFLPRDGMDELSDHTEILYYATSRAAAGTIQREGFRQSSGGPLGRGVYLSRDLQKARRYPLEPPESQRVVIKVKVNVGRVIEINRQGHPMQKTWHDSGYDTAWVPPTCGMVPSGMEDHCVWDPTRITFVEILYPKYVPQPFSLAKLWR
ncbi:uncharacterized protein LOC134453932 [Engraulis encrasicolus]|uniref:uncharacterized protein LOC134453932 n=1 Tax=Engraulis encrasicolus TaxID=184585 RepID=UPI002FCF3527